MVVCWFPSMWMYQQGPTGSMSRRLPMTTPKKPLVIGVTGGIGSGKSSVARLLAECSGIVVDADQIAHEALRQPEILGRVVAQFGTTVIGPDGAIDRKRLGKIVFSAPEKRVALEAIVLPWIRGRIHLELSAARARTDCRIVVLDAPLLIEGGWTDHVDVMIHVDSSFSSRLARVQDRGWDESELKRRAPLDRQAGYGRSCDQQFWRVRIASQPSASYC
ncbi:MAG: dephospho-CoA kinase [Planctomycetes bacterium]|nr:dephospho-CoA kinase [Planctomycetota bacterium]